MGEADKTGATQQHKYNTQSFSLLGFSFKTPWPSVDNKRPRGLIQRETMTPQTNHHNSLSRMDIIERNRFE